MMNLKSKILLLVVLIPAILVAVESNALYEQGIEAFNSGNYGNSELIFRKVVSSADDYEVKDKAWYYLARSIYQQKKYKAAMLEFNRFLNNCRTPGLAIESRYWIAESNFFLGDHIKAIEEYKRFISQSRDKNILPLAHDRIASIYFSQTRYDEAVIEWEKAISLSADASKNALWIYYIGRSQFENRKYDESLQRLSPLLTSRADVKTIALSRIIIARIHQANGNHRGALLILNGIPDTLLKEFPYYDAQYFKAKSYVELGNPAAAKNSLNLFLLIGKESEWHYDALYESALLSLNTGDSEKAIDTLEQVRKNTKKIELKSRSAKELSKIFIKSDPARSIPYLEDSMNTKESNDENREAMLLLGRAYVNMGDGEKAASIFLKFIDKYPFAANMDEAYFTLGKIYYMKNRYDLATDYFNKLKQYYPFSRYLNEIDFYEGLIFFNNSDFKNAADKINKYTARKNIENRYEATVVLLDSQIALDDRLNAVKTANILMKNHISDKDIDKALYTFCLYQIKNGNRPDFYFDRIIQKFPDGLYAVKIYLHYAEEAFNSKNYKRAAEYFIKYAGYPDAESKGNAYYSAVVSYFNLKDYDKIIKLSEGREIPSMEIEQLRTVTGLTAVSYRIKGNFSKAYMLLLYEDMKHHDQQVRFVFIESSAAIGDIESAEKILPLMKENPELYGDSCMIIAGYFRSKKNLIASEKYAKIVINELAEHRQSGAAHLLHAELYLEKNDFTQAIESAQRVADKNKIDEATSVIAIALFGLGRSQEGFDLSRKSIRGISKTIYAERLIILNSNYAFSIQDQTAFALFISYLKGFRGYEDYIAFHNAELGLARGNFQQALLIYTQLSLKENPYQRSSLERCAEINIFYLKNKKKAEKYYFDLLKEDGLDIQVKKRAIINLALILHESGRKEESLEVLTGQDSLGAYGLFFIQTENLIEFVNMN